MIPNNILAMLGNVGNLNGVKSPDELAQFLLNSGRVTQAQVNQAKQMWKNPQIQQMINRKFG